MTVLPLSRRLVAVMAASGLALTGLAVANSASAAGPCPTYIDPAGDAVPGDPGLYPAVGEPDLDLLAVSHSVDAGVFTSMFKVAALTTYGSETSAGDSFQALFTVAGKAVIMKATRNAADPTGDPVITAALSVGGTTSTAKVTATFDTKASTVTLGVSTDDLVKAVAAPLDGQVFSAMSAKSASFYPNPAPSPANYSGLIYDTATAPATAAYAFGGSCSGDAAPVGSGTPAPSGSAAPPLPRTDGPSGPVLLDQPRKKCLQFPDAAGDAATNPISGQGLESDNDLDIIGAVYRTSPDALQAYVSVTTLGTGPDSTFSGNFYDTHSFSTGFTLGGKAIVLTAGATGPATATVGGTASTALHATAAFDTKHSNIVFSVPLADLATLTAQPVKGAAVTALTASSVASSSMGAPGGTGDSAAPATAAQKTYVVGDNTCFLPPAGVLTIDGNSGVYSDVTTIYGNLVDVDGAAVEGAKVTLTLTGMPAKTATTDSDGDATFTFPVTVKVGAKTVGVSFAGNADVGAATASAPFKVALESTVLKAVGSKGAVTATLSDNDGHRLAKRVVVFTVGSKVTRVTTNAKGQAVLKNLARGAAVKVSFAAVSGYYSAAKTVSAKAL